MARVGAWTGAGLYQENRHKECVAKKKEKIAMLILLLDEYEKRGDWEYVRELRTKLRLRQTELRVMKP